jgi:hypothetical protein
MAKLSGGNSWPRRSLTDGERQKLWGESWRLCNNPSCRQPCIIEGEAHEDGFTIVGEHAHIVAHSAAGPRGDPMMTPDRRNALGNFVLLCRPCHKMVDLRSNEAKFPKEKLREWKAVHQHWLNITIPMQMGRADPAEIKVVCAAVMGDGDVDGAGFVLTDIATKIKKNELSNEVRQQLRMGLAIADRVRGVLNGLANVDPQIPDRTRDGIALKYTELRERWTGDELFHKLWTFAAGGQTDSNRRSAALAVLAYFFHACDVFEP